MRSRVELTNAVVVRIKGNRRVRNSRFEVADDDLLGEFLRWLVEHPHVEFYLQSSGLGSCIGWGPAASREPIEEFFKSREARMSYR